MPGLPESSLPEILIAPCQTAEAFAVYADWSDLVERIRSGETEGMEELYQLLSADIPSYFYRQLGPQELDDKVHDLFVYVVQAIRRGELLQPENLMGFVRTIARRQVAAYLDRAVHSHRDPDPDPTMPITVRQENPEEAAVFHERTELMKRVLAELPARDREILTRFYLLEQSQDQVCSEMSLTEAQFRLLRSRAKSRFVELGKRMINSRGQDRYQRRRESDSNLSRSDDETNTNRYPSLDMSRILPVIAHAVAVFGDEHKASHWLATSLPILDARSPSQLIESQEGIDLVERILTRIEHNIPS